MRSQKITCSGAQHENELLTAWPVELVYRLLLGKHIVNNENFKKLSHNK